MVLINIVSGLCTYSMYKIAVFPINSSKKVKVQKKEQFKLLDNFLVIQFLYAGIG